MRCLAATGRDGHIHSEDDNSDRDDGVMVGSLCQWRAHSLVTVSKAGPIAIALLVCRGLQGISQHHAEWPYWRLRKQGQ